MDWFGINHILRTGSLRLSIREISACVLTFTPLFASAIACLKLIFQISTPLYHAVSRANRRNSMLSAVFLACCENFSMLKWISFSWCWAAFTFISLAVETFSKDLTRSLKSVSSQQLTAVDEITVSSRCRKRRSKVSICSLSFDSRWSTRSDKVTNRVLLLWFSNFRAAMSFKVSVTNLEASLRWWAGAVGLFSWASISRWVPYKVKMSKR